MSPTFALAAGRDPATFLGGVIRAGNRDVDLLAELEAGNGTIETDDPQVIAALDNHRALQRVGDDAETTDVGTQGETRPPDEVLELADGNTREALNALALEAGIEDPAATATKLELAALIVAAQAAQPDPQDDQAGDAGDAS